MIFALVGPDRRPWGSVVAQGRPPQADEDAGLVAGVSAGELDRRARRARAARRRPPPRAARTRGETERRRTRRRCAGPGPRRASGTGRTAGPWGQGEGEGLDADVVDERGPGDGVGRQVGRRERVDLEPFPIALVGLRRAGRFAKPDLWMPGCPKMSRIRNPSWSPAATFAVLVTLVTSSSSPPLLQMMSLDLTSKIGPLLFLVLRTYSYTPVSLPLMINDSKFQCPSTGARRAANDTNATTEQRTINETQGGGGSEKRRCRDDRHQSNANNADDDNTDICERMGICSLITSPGCTPYC